MGLFSLEKLLLLNTTTLLEEDKDQNNTERKKCLCFVWLHYNIFGLDLLCYTRIGRKEWWYIFNFCNSSHFRFNYVRSNAKVSEVTREVNETLEPPDQKKK